MEGALRDHYETIGGCIVDSEGTILELHRQYFRQGFIFKDSHAFHNAPEAPCYVPELSDTVYTGKDFLKICGGQKNIAELVFDAVDWQHPETYLDEQFREGEFAVCEACGKIFESYGAYWCPNCGAEKFGCNGRGKGL